MDRETAKAINDVSKKVNEIAERLDNYLNSRCDTNEDNIEQAMSDNAELLYELSLMELNLHAES